MNQDHHKDFKNMCKAPVVYYDDTIKCIVVLVSIY